MMSTMVRACSAIFYRRFRRYTAIRYCELIATWGVGGRTTLYFTLLQNQGTFASINLLWGNKFVLNSLIKFSTPLYKNVLIPKCVHLTLSRYASPTLFIEAQTELPSARFLGDFCKLSDNRIIRTEIHHMSDFLRISQTLKPVSWEGNCDGRVG